MCVSEEGRFLQEVVTRKLLNEPFFISFDDPQPRHSCCSSSSFVMGPVIMLAVAEIRSCWIVLPNTVEESIGELFAPTNLFELNSVTDIFTNLV